MGKKRIVTTKADDVSGKSSAGGFKTPRKKHNQGKLYVQSTYNNTIVTLTDREGNALAWSSSGSLSFKGAKKGTPFAAGKVSEIIADKALAIGIKDVDVVVSGVGAGRESAVRSFVSRGGFNVLTMRDVTPVPHNGPRAPKPRRV